MTRIRLSITTAACLFTIAACSSPPTEEVTNNGSAETEVVVASSDETAILGCGSDDDCGDGEFCQFTLGECGGEGTCEVRPQICTMDYTPVCGCDGETYSNACGAAAAGMSIEAEGECA